MTLTHNTKGMKRDEKEKAMKKYKKLQSERFVNLIQYMDKLIGKLMQKSKDLWIYDNTYFIFSAHNGTATTAKDRAVERGVHVPYVIKGPGITRRGLTQELTDFSDIAPTLLEMAGIKNPSDIPFDGKSQIPFLSGKTETHREWIYAYTGAVQILRTKTHLLEARSPLFGKPDGRLYFTGLRRFGLNYQRVDSNPEHSAARLKFIDLIKNLPSHLEKDHPFWESKYGKRWLSKNKDMSGLKNKQLYNHSDFKRYDETD